MDGREKKRLIEGDICTKFTTPALAQAGPGYPGPGARGSSFSPRASHRADLVLRASYPAGVVSYNKTRPMRFEEFQPEIEWWGSEGDGFAARVETKQAWKVSIEEIKARNYNLDIKNPHVVEQISHHPDELLEKYARQQAEVAATREALKKELQGEVLIYQARDGQASPRCPSGR